MELKDQICTVEQALKFEELGIKNHYHGAQGGTFKWTKHERLPGGGAGYNTREWTAVPSSYLDGFGHQGSPYALNVAELGILLPDSFNSYYSEHLGCWMWQAIEMVENLDGDSEWTVTHSDSAEYDSEAEARAAALLYCIEKQLVTVEDLNKLLKCGKK